MSIPQIALAVLLGCLGILATESGCATSGCATSNYTHGVPNLVQVRATGPAVWRSGQPVTADAWDYLSRLGVRHVVKLDFDDEGLETEAELRGMEVIRIPIEPTTKAGFVDLVEDVFAEPSAESMAAILNVLYRIKESRRSFEDDGWLIHCKNGHDRTGLVVGMLRMVVDGWDRHHAWSEMLDRGYHPELVGLDRAFHDFAKNFSPPRQTFPPKDTTP